MDEKNNNFITIRVKTDTYHKLEKLISEKKQKNLAKTGRVGDANFDGIINDILENYNGGKE